MLKHAKNLKQLYDWLCSKQLSYCIYYMQDETQPTLMQLRFLMSTNDPITSSQYTAVEIADILWSAYERGLIILTQKREHGLCYYMARKSNAWSSANQFINVPHLWKQLHKAPKGKDLHDWTNLANA